MKMMMVMMMVKKRTNCPWGITQRGFKVFINSGINPVSIGWVVPKSPIPHFLCGKSFVLLIVKSEMQKKSKTCQKVLIGTYIVEVAISCLLFCNIKII